MSKYIYIAFLCLFLAACHDEDVLDYQLTEDCIQFDLETAAMSQEINFANRSYLVEVGTGYVQRYSGDSVLCDTLVLPLSIMGWESENPRSFRLRVQPVVDGVDTLGLAELGIDSSYVFDADRLVDTIRIVYMRPEAGLRLGAGITFDVARPDAEFDLGAAEKSVYKLVVSNVYTRPDNWNVDYLGEFSQAKAAFIVTYYQNSLSNFGDDWSPYNAALRKALDDYNAGHPDAPLDFTFPVNTKPSWWERQAQYLGDYSEAKNAFMTRYLGNYSEYMGQSWEWISLYLGYYYDIYFEENPDAEPFENTFRSVSEPSWWADNSQWIGAFSTEKALMFEYLYGGSGIWSNGNEYDWEEQLPMLQEAYDYYYFTSSPTPPYFDDDFSGGESVEPEWWAEWSGYLGEYTDLKKQFMEMQYNESGDDEWWTSGAAGVDWATEVPNMVALLERWGSFDLGTGDVLYPSDFYPNGDWTPEPEWWAEWSGYLGEYTELKKQFMEMQYDDSGDGEWWTSGAGSVNWAAEIPNMVTLLERWGSFDLGTGDVLYPEDFYADGSWVEGQPKWWRKWSGYLGAYTDLKKQFMEMQYDDSGDGEWWTSGAADVDWAAEIPGMVELLERWGSFDLGTGDVLYPTDFYPNGDWTFGN